MPWSNPSLHPHAEQAELGSEARASLVQNKAGWAKPSRIVMIEDRSLYYPRESQPKCCIDFSALDQGTKGNIHDSIQVPSENNRAKGWTNLVFFLLPLPKYLLEGGRKREKRGREGRRERGREEGRERVLRMIRDLPCTRSTWEGWIVGWIHGGSI